MGSLPSVPSSLHARTPRALPSGAQGGVWTELPPPVARAAAAGVVDTTRGQVVLFGGSDGALRNDLWVLTLSDTAWHKVVPFGFHPTGRVGHSAVLDTLRDRMIVFGGWDGEYKNDVWALSLADSSWAQLTPTGTPPSARASHTAVYDAALDRMLVFGGWDGTSSDQVWALDLSGSGHWSQLTPAGPGPSGRYGHSAVYDRIVQRMIVFGGEHRDGEATYLNDTWVLDLRAGPAWSRLPTRIEIDEDAVVAGAPPVRYAHSGVFSPERALLRPDSTASADSGRMVVFGGWYSQHLNDAWEYSFADSTWRQIVIGTPPTTRSHHVALLDSRTSRMLVLWGWGAGNPRGDQAALALTGTAGWTTLASIRTTPPRRHSHTAVYDRARDRMVVFGGGHLMEHKRDVWQFLLASSLWQQISASGPLPPISIDPAAAFDSSAVRMIVFGGKEIFNGGIDTILHDEVSVLSLSGAPTWARPAPQQLPWVRRNHSVVVDAARRRLILFGGIDSLGSLRNDVWLLDSNLVWTQLVPLGTSPSPRAGHAAIYDSTRQRMVVFGGNTGVANDEVWTLSFAGTPRWERATVAAGAPARSLAGAVRDVAGDRMIVFGGLGGTVTPDTLGDVWALSLGDPMAWSPLSPTGTAPSARYGHTAVYDPGARRIAYFGGRGRGGDERGKRNDLWTLTLADLAWQELAPQDSAATNRPRGVAEHAAAFDPRRGRMVTFGGGSDTLRLARVVWSYFFDAAAWSADTSWPGPIPISGHSATRDPHRDTLLVFGGSNADPLNNNTTFSSGLRTYALDFPPVWGRASFGSHMISGRSGHTMVLDALRNRMLVFGGLGADSSNVWALSLTDFGWSRVEVLGTPPPPRENHTAIYDPVRHRMIVFGGWDGGLRNDVWALNLGEASTWAQLTPAGTAPEGRYAHTAVYDPARDVMRVFAGWSGTYLDDVWELSLGETPAWSEVTAIGQEMVERASHTAIQDVLRDRMVVFAGYATARDGESRSDTWFFSPSTGVDLISSATVLSLDTQPGMVRLTWQVQPGAHALARVYRSVDGGAWTPLASVRANASGALTYADVNARGASRFGYRLGIPRAGREDAAGEVWVNGPTDRPAMAPIAHPSPAAHGFSVSFTLPDSRAATLEVFDLAGRRVWDRRFDRLGPGSHTVRVAEGGTFAPGVYLLRLTQGTQRYTSRVVVAP